MAIRGRKPKPTHLHLVEGTTHVTRHRSRADEAKPVGNLSDPPDWMTPGQVVVWGYAITHAPKGLLKKIDLSTFSKWVVACEAFQRTAVIIGHMPAEDFVVQGARGETISASLRALQVTSTLMLRAATELGFTPASRARVTVDKDNAGASPEEEFFPA